MKKFNEATEDIYGSFFWQMDDDVYWAAKMADNTDDLASALTDYVANIAASEGFTINDADNINWQALAERVLQDIENHDNI